MDCTGRLATNYTHHTQAGQMNSSPYHFICVLPVKQFDITFEVCLIY